MSARNRPKREWGIIRSACQWPATRTNRTTHPTPISSLSRNATISKNAKNAIVDDDRQCVSERLL